MAVLFVGRMVMWKYAWRSVSIFVLPILFDISAIYDCAAFTALPAETRSQYVRHLGHCYRVPVRFYC